MAQIKYALGVARALSFTRAAADCNVSQPALTKAVRTLEGELGSPLFHREGKRVLISEFGRSMLPHLQHIADEAETARALAINFRLVRNAPIRLGVLSTIGHVRLSRLLGDFQRDFESIEVTVQEGSLVDISRRLRDGELDLAVLNPQEQFGADFTLIPLYSERYVVIVAAEHRLAASSTIKLSELSGESYVDRLACEMREMVMSVCADRKIELYARFRSEREDWVQAMVLARIGFAFMPEYSVTLPGIISRPLVDPEVQREVALASMPGRQHSPAIAAFVRAARSFPWPG
ncbi:MAG TPA: LysR substrate-binding domain-containing protein [Stellaceae bacterium]|nr:LysR substrate-binding domain-containing protein [Stellaceae bacterium]